MDETNSTDNYLADRYDGGLVPTTPRGRAEALRWSFWAMGEFEGPIDAAARREAKLEPGWAKAPLAVLDQSLASGPWLLGERFGVADVNVSVMLVRPTLAKEGTAEFANVTHWWARLQERLGFQRMEARAKR